MDALSLQTTIAAIVDRWVDETGNPTDTDLRDQLLQLFIERWSVVILEHLMPEQRTAVAALIDAGDMIALQEVLHTQLRPTAVLASVHQTEHELTNELFTTV